METATGTLYTEPCEQVFRRNSRAARCALIGLGPRGRQRPAIVVETKLKDDADGRAFAHELRTLALAHAHTSGIEHFYFKHKDTVWGNLCRPRSDRISQIGGNHQFYLATNF